MGYPLKKSESLRTKTPAKNKRLIQFQPGTEFEAFSKISNL